MTTGTIKPTFPAGSLGYGLGSREVTANNAARRGRSDEPNKRLTLGDLRVMKLLTRNEH
jgi:hypothetical protein